jgi:hypothetical protein
LLDVSGRPGDGVRGAGGGCAGDRRGFAFVGAWLVLPFAGIEALMLAVAFFVVARRAGAEGEEQKQLRV